MQKILNYFRLFLYPLIIFGEVVYFISILPDTYFDIVIAFLAIVVYGTGLFLPLTVIFLFYILLWSWIDLIILFFQWRKKQLPSKTVVILICTAFALFIFAILFVKQSIKIPEDYYINDQPRCTLEDQPVLVGLDDTSIEIENNFKDSCTLKDDCRFFYLSKEIPYGSKEIACCPRLDKELYAKKDGKLLYPECFSPEDRAEEEK